MKSQGVISGLIYGLFAIPMLYQTVDITRQYMKDDIKQVVTDEEGTPVESMLTCLPHLEAGLEKPLQDVARFIRAHSVTREVPKAWNDSIPRDSRLRRMSPKELLEKYQELHTVHFLRAQGIDRKLFVIPSPRKKSEFCGRVQSYKAPYESNSKSFTIRRDQASSTRDFWLRIPKQKQATFQSLSLSFSFADFSGAILLDPNVHCRTLDLKSSTGVGAGLALKQVVSVKLKKFVNKNRAKRPCEGQSGGFHPVGAAKVICAASCESKAFHQVLNCSHLAWFGDSVEGLPSGYHQCRSDEMWDEMVRKSEEIRRLARDCEREMGCKTARRCEEWAMDVQLLGDNVAGFANGKFSSNRTVLSQNIEVFYDPTMTVTREVPEMSFSQWIAAIGGLVGLYFELGLATLAVWVVGRFCGTFASIGTKTEVQNVEK